MSDPATALPDHPAGAPTGPRLLPGGSVPGLVELDVGTRLDPAEAVRLRRAVAALCDDHALVGLRVDRVVAFDAAGLGLLLGLHRLARAKGAGLLVVGPTDRLLTALRRRGLHRVLVIETLTEDRARAAVTAPGTAGAPGPG